MTDLLAIMGDLDTASNLFGPLRPDLRARLFAVIGDPTPATWEEAHCIIVNSGDFTTLWQAVVRHTSYDVTSKPLDSAWPRVPSTEQIITALRLAVQSSDPSIPL